MKQRMDYDSTVPNGLSRYGSTSIDEKASAQCLDLNLKQEMDSLIGRAHQIFIVMPAKAGGSSMDRFSARCTKSRSEKGRFGFIQRHDQTKLLVDSLHFPRIISSHISHDAGLIRLAKHPSKKILVIYIHREEGERVVSGVKMIAHQICRNNGRNYTETGVVIEKNKTHCILDEGLMVNFIAERHREVGGGAPDILTCNFYNVVQENAPQLVFLHFKQSDKLQTLLAKYHCPELLDELPIKVNVADEKERGLFLYDGKSDASSAKGVVRIEEWLDAKGPALEWALNLRSNASCQAKTVRMEEALFGCPDEALKVTPDSIK